MRVSDPPRHLNRRSCASKVSRCVRQVHPELMAILYTGTLDDDACEAARSLRSMASDNPRCAEIMIRNAPSKPFDFKARRGLLAHEGNGSKSFEGASQRKFIYQQKHHRFKKILAFRRFA
ncbi:unnamed protein product [Brassica rapa subsp. trilocularis]